MIGYIFFVFTMCYKGISLFHDIPITVYDFYTKEKMLYVDINIDPEYLASENLVIVNAQSIEKMFNQKMKVKVNNRSQKISIKSIIEVSQHLKITGVYGSIYPEVSSVEIENTLLHEIRNHSHIIQINLNNQRRDFRMFKKRTFVKIEY